jgi:hypothetical protein
MTFRNFMNTQKFKLIFFEYTTINKMQIDHIWTDAPTQQCHLGSIQAYWSNHKHVYVTFRLPNYVPCFITPKKNTYSHTFKHQFQKKSLNLHFCLNKPNVPMLMNPCDHSII